MNKSNNISKVIVILIIGLVLLVGCGNKMYDQAMEQGRLAVANKEYEKAQASFELALEEKDDEETKNMLMEVKNMIAGLKSKENGNIKEALDYFNEIIEGDAILTSIVEEAKELELELKEIEEKMNSYDGRILKAESMIEDKQYEESKRVLNELIEDTNNIEIFNSHNKKAQELIKEIDLALEKAEKSKQEEKARKKEEAEKKRTPLDKAFEVAKESLGTSSVSYQEIYHENELYYYFSTTDYPRVNVIISPNGKMYDAYTYNREGWLDEI